MATLGEICQASMVAMRTCADLTLLKCTSAYPATAEDANLTAGQMLPRLTFAKAWGLSDHSLGMGVAVAAAALGAAVIEKHLTLSRDDGGPDAAFSMEPDEFTQMVTECRRAAAAIGEARYGPTPSEASSLELRRPPGGKRGQLKA
jgi:sialic acid synthase SpsE